MPDEKKAGERIALRNDQQTTIAIGLSRKGKTAIEPGDKILVASSAVTILCACFNPGTGVVDVIPVEGGEGPADVSVAITLADGTALPSKTVEYDVTNPDTEAVTLTAGSIGEKKTVIAVHRPNPEAHTVPAPKVEPVRAREKLPA